MSWISDTVRLSNRAGLNGSIEPLSNNLMLRVLGSPRGNYDQECRPVTNGRIRNLIVTEDVGPFRVTGLKPVVEKLRAALADVKQKEPECYNALGSAGMLCTRYVRGSKTSISNHSWGCAIDFTLEGKLDTRGDDKAQKGLIRMHPIFNSHDFFWGAAFKTEDAMHFEISRQQMLKWNEEGVFGDPVALHEEARLVALGDRGPQVEWIQERLNLVLGLDVEEDGIFGAATRASVIQFQRHAGIRPDGVATNDTMEALRRASPQ